MPATHWVDNDPGYEQWVSENPDGFVANTNRQPHAKYFRIHRASHRLPDRSSANSVNPWTGTQYSKVTASTLADVIQWAKDNIPGFTLSDANYCKQCCPDYDGPPVDHPGTTRY
jgi:5-methylcytosine-specific restriction protein A